MRRRHFIQAAGLGTLASLLPAGVGCLAARKLNILFILIDHLGWADTGCYGSSFYETPNIDRLAEEGKTIALIAASMHATEIGPTQMSPELGYVLATDESPEIQAILDNVIFLLVPSWNPDGNIMVVDWYRENLGTPFEKAPMPWLYHHYVGHDNNRDSFMHTQVETRYVNNILYHEWFPQIFMDMHHMGNWMLVCSSHLYTIRDITLWIPYSPERSH